jgi:hypothetical protein
LEPRSDEPLPNLIEGIFDKLLHAKIDAGIILVPSSRVLGENTPSTASLGFVQPGGGSFFAFAQALTALHKNLQSKSLAEEDLQEAKASPPVTTQHFDCPKEILLAASSNNFAG